MAVNPYIGRGVRSEQNLLEDLTIETLKMYGQDVYYLPRTIVNEDRILGDDVPSRFSNAYAIEMYIENTEGFDGEGDLFSKFGVEIRDQATFILARRRWTQTVAKLDNEINGLRPREGDLIYLPLSKSLFQIMSVEHEQPFYQLKGLYTFKLRCELFEYNDEDLDTGLYDIDKIEQDYAYKYILTLDSAGAGFDVNTTVSQTLSSGVVMNGEVAKWSDSDNKLHLIHIGSDDNSFHEFVSGLAVYDSASNRVLVSSVVEDNQISGNEQNADFSDEIASFLDFSESNPFGDPENN